MTNLASAFLMPGDLYESTVQKLYFEMRKECKVTLVANKNERLEGDVWCLDSLACEWVGPGIIQWLLRWDHRDCTDATVIATGDVGFDA